jgi:hypothetical protein
MTVVASGTTSLAAFLYPAKASIATCSIPSRKASGALPVLSGRGRCPGVLVGG